MDDRQFGVDDYNRPGYWDWWQQTYGDENSRRICDAMEFQTRIDGGFPYLVIFQDGDTKYYGLDRVAGKKSRRVTRHTWLSRLGIASPKDDFVEVEVTGMICLDRRRGEVLVVLDGGGACLPHEIKEMSKVWK